MSRREYSRWVDSQDGTTAFIHGESMEEKTYLLRPLTDAEKADAQRRRLAAMQASAAIMSEVDYGHS